MKINKYIIAALLALCLVAAAPSVHYINELWLTDTVYDDMLIPLITGERRGTAEPDLKTFTDGIMQYAFSGTVDEEVHAAIQLTHRWREGSTIYCHLHHAPETSATGNVRWCSEFSFASVNGTFGSSTTLCSDCAVSGTALKHYVCDWGAISMAGHTISAVGVGRFYREGSHANDTLDGVDVFGLYADCHIEVNTMGSRTEWTK